MQLATCQRNVLCRYCKWRQDDQVRLTALLRRFNRLGSTLETDTLKFTVYLVEKAQTSDENTIFNLDK